MLGLKGKNFKKSELTFYCSVLTTFFILVLISVEHGVYLEKWDTIDYNRVEFLQADPRYPDLPSYTTCFRTFEQPSNWDDFFGTRLRTYFVPTENGIHYFMICKLFSSAMKDIRH